MRLHVLVRRLLLPAALASAVLLAAPPRSDAAPQEPPRQPEVDRAVRAAWRGLPTSRTACPNWYDSFPHGGVAKFYCHAQTLLSLEQLEGLAGMPSTRSLPGAVGEALRHAFRQYDPRFVEWLRRALLPARSDRRFREETQPIYDRYVGPLARKWLATRRLMMARRAWTDAEVRWLREGIVKGTLPSRFYYSRYEGFGAPARASDGRARGLEPGLWDGNVGSNAVAYWLRRELDGSAESFAAALEELVSIYDGAWLRGGAGILWRRGRP